MLIQLPLSEEHDGLSRAGNVAQLFEKLVVCLNHFQSIL